MRPFSNRVRAVIKAHREQWDAWRAAPRDPSTQKDYVFLIDACMPRERFYTPPARAEIKARLNELQQMSVVELMPLLIELR